MECGRGQAVMQRWGAGELMVKVICILIFILPLCLIAETTAFDYRGNLIKSGVPANGLYELTFALYSTNIGGAPVTGIILTNSVAVSNGQFSAVLDFGNALDGTPCWLEIGIRSNEIEEFTALVPRQPITPIPYALHAYSATTTTGPILASQLPPGIPSVADTNVTFAGMVSAASFTGDGSTLAGVTKTANNLGDLSDSKAARSNIGALASTNGVAYGQTNFGTLHIKTNSFVPLAELHLDSGQGLRFGPDSAVTSIYYNDQHSPYGELQIACNSSISLNEAMNGVSGSVIQLGRSYASHGRVQIQYDYNIGLGATQGYSKILNLVGIYSADNGTTYKNTYVGIQGFNVNTNGDMTLKFYNPSPQWSGNANSATLVGGVVQGEMRTNGWLFNGIMDRQLNTPSSFAFDSTNIVFIDFNRADFKTVSIIGAASNVVLVSSNLINLTGGREVHIRLLNGAYTNTLVFPSWIFRNDAMPTNLPPFSIGILTLLAYGSNDTSIFATWDTATQMFAAANPESDSFISAAGISTVPEKQAIDDFVSYAKSHNFFTNLIAFYPNMGGNSVSCSKDLMGGHQITWSASGVSFGSDGVTFDGVTGYGNMGVSPAAAFPSKDDTMYFVWIKNPIAPADGAWVIGAQGNGVYSGIGRVGNNLAAAG